MRGVLTGVVLGMTLVSGSVFGEEPKRVIVALGDSITAGSPGFQSPREFPPNGRGNPQSQYAYWMTKKHPDWRVINQGVAGQRSEHILSRFDRDVSAFDPDMLIVMAGVNDLYQGRSAADIIPHLTAIYEKAAALKIKTAACTVLPYDGMPQQTYSELQKLNGWIREYSEGHNLIFCDTSRLLEDAARPGNLISSADGLHPDVAGYQKIGELITANLEQVSG